MKLISFSSLSYGISFSTFSFSNIDETKISVTLADVSYSESLQLCLKITLYRLTLWPVIGQTFGLY